MPERKSSKSRKAGTRRAIIEFLKQNGPQDAKTIAERLEITQMAVRLHLHALRDQKLVRSSREHRPVGRPTQIWQLTSAADQFFPDGHADLVVSLVKTLSKTFGSARFDDFLQALCREKIEEYGSSVAREALLERRVKALAKLRTKEGYMAEVQTQKDGSLLLIENHCPICVAAESCLGLCANELTVFRKVLGENASVERTEHIQAGEHRCVYRIQERGLKGKAT